MKYDKPGEYTLIYKAEDECGNTTEQIRNVIVESVEPTERLLFTGGAEDVCAYDEQKGIAVFTPIFTKPYSGYARVVFTNLRFERVYSGGGKTIVTYPTYESNTVVQCVSANEYSYSQIDILGYAYITGDDTFNYFVNEDATETRCAKWDSLEIWTKAGE